jgi:glycosyltransferase involved in cell wall biosynthesis
MRATVHRRDFGARFPERTQRTRADARAVRASRGTSPLRILVIADAKIPVPPAGYGGTERIIALLCQGLAARGHEVTLMAAKGSRNYGRLITHPWPGSRPYHYRAWCKLRFQAQSLWHARNADLIINSGRVDYLEGLLRTSRPLICRFDNPIDQSMIDFLLARRRLALALVSVSDHQRAHLAETDLWRTVYNAVDTDRLTFAPRPDPGYLAFLGRLTENKGVHVAIEVARRLGRPLRIAGNISDEAGGREFFETRVRPQLGAGIEWIGPVDDVAKVPFLQNASALLFPIQWDEPFGLSAAEALACGTPVIAMRRVSMPELIRHDVTGFLCRSTDEMVDAVSRLGAIDRRTCRQDCERRFSAERMVEEYLDVARSLVGPEANAQDLAAIQQHTIGRMSRQTHA